MHCNEEITVNYIKEAARLLSNSILKVEKPDMQLEQGEQIEGALD